MSSASTEVTYQHYLITCAWLDATRYYGRMTYLIDAIEAVAELRVQHPTVEWDETRTWAEWRELAPIQFNPLEKS